MNADSYKSKETGTKHYKQLDADFKRAVHNTDILSNVVGELVSELNGMDVEHIKRCISPDDLSTISGLETEMHNDSGEYVVMDNLFSITIPGEKKIGLLVNVEGQGDSEPGYPILNRALFYASGIIFNQKGAVFRGSHYEGLRKTYSIWFILQPRKGEENSLVRYPLMRIPGSGRDLDRAENSNLLEIIIVNLGGAQGAPNRAFRMFNDIFLSTSKGEEYRDHLREYYNIEVDDTTLESLERIGMSLGEEIVNFQRREGYKLGFESGYEQGHEVGREEGREEGIEEGYGKADKAWTIKVIGSQADAVIRVMSKIGMSREEAMELVGVSDDDRDEVNRIVDEKLSSN